jgi:uncharacterized repeat protein (TIGR01451 family)
LDILAATRSGQVFVWSTSTPYNLASLPWPTGRHDLRRSATFVTLTPDLSPSFIVASPANIRIGDTASFTIHVASMTPVGDALSLTNSIPSGLLYVPGTLTASSGVATESGGVIKWNGILTGSLTADIKYKVTVNQAIIQTIANSDIQTISNSFTVETISDQQFTRTGILSITKDPVIIFLPFLRK